jgi:hypothetical protein
MFRQVLQGVRRAFLRMLLTLVATGTLLLGYGLGLIWFETRSAPTTFAWLLIAPAAAVAALLSASLVVLWTLGPVLAMGRVLRYLTRLPAVLAADPHLSTRELARRLECSEEEAGVLRHLIGSLLERVQPESRPPTLVT